MQAGADIVGRLWRAAWRRRAPIWLGAVLPWCLLLSVPGVLATVVLALWDGACLYRRVAANWARWLDSALPAVEDSSALLASAASPIGQLQRQRVMNRFTSRDLSNVARTRVDGGYHWIAVSFLAAGAVWAWGARANVSVAIPKAAQAVVAKSRLVVHVVPPTYTAVPAFESAPRDLVAPQHSEVRWCTSEAGDAVVELSDGRHLQVKAGCARSIATETVFWRWRGERYTLRVTPDAPPLISVTKPADMVQLLAADAGSAAIAVSVRDDYLVRRATLHLTLARGSGENIRFSDRELALPQSSDPRVRNWSKQWSLHELGMEPGDELYFFVRASDNAEPPHNAQSPTYTLRLAGPQIKEDETSALPMLVSPESLRSQRQVIIDTEQLVADMKVQPRLAAATLRSRSEAIGADQARLRRRYGQFLGEESTLFGDDDHDKEGDKQGDKQGDKDGGKRDVLAQFGHAHDQAESATLFDEATKKILRRALAAMWDAEKALRALTPASALPPELKALEAVKQLQQADRIYLHKTAFAPPPIREEIRMSGDVVGTRSYRREQGQPGEAVPAQLRELLGALGGDSALPALWSRTAHESIRAHIANDEQRLEAQRAVQDVADGCAACRPVLRAWLRGAILDAPVLLRATPTATTPFVQAWRKAAP